MDNVINNPFLALDAETKEQVVVIKAQQYYNLLKAQQELDLLQSIARGEEDIKNGRVYTEEEFKKKLGIN